MARIEIGKHLATDNRVCRGRLVFKGTRILVSDTLELVEAGYTPEAVAKQYRDAIKAEAVREAQSLIRRGFIKEVVSKTETAA